MQGRGGRRIPPPQPFNSRARELRDYMQELRKESGWTIAAIAQHGGGSPVTLAAALRGPRLPSWRTIELFLLGLDVNEDDVHFNKYDGEPSWADSDFLLAQSDVVLRLRGLWLAARAAARGEADQTSTRTDSQVR
ncbi:helix-turn-helix domain protein [Catenulispora acidiphila DSM 44928]|uniref:Helix-turn-helix domain protein n=1 Tax=Catenulispora acidiphila (strain DSM 44928 / JCM 14897 / NBRC 102108 / NRRL B-24433 / ID139908) TaxID=479433 RepID=C7QEP3_CATAD|nr:helix-turn-helix domain protein [Catenulispora acidiphila DSM 44928]